MASLYVTDQNAVLRKRGRRLSVHKDGAVLLDVPCEKIDTVLIFGNVQFTTQAAVRMLDEGIEMALLSVSGRLRGQLTPPKAKNVELRMAQYRRSGEQTTCLELGRAVVRGKVANSAAVLRRFQANHPGVLDAGEIAALEAAAEGVAAAGSLDALRGLEGAAAARYFGLLPRLLTGDVTFTGRRRRPPRDPVNALLSLGYVLVGNELQALLDGMGFDPYVGFYHQLDYGRPSLALDLLEEFRPALVDRLTVRLFNRRALGPADFTGHPSQGTRLGPDSLKRYLAAYEAELTAELTVDGEATSFRRLFHRQAERLARWVTRGEPYESFRLPC